jgi:molecular chaperone DnaK
VPQIEVTFDIDANGIVSVSAKDKATSKEQKMQIQPSGGLSESDIQRMVKEAEEHAADDRARREIAEAKNQGEALVHSTEKQLAEHGSKVSATDKAAIESAIAALKTALEGEHSNEIRAKSQTLAQAAMKIGEAMYAGQDGAAEDAEKSDSGVVDAEFEEVDGQSKKSA